jgi:WD repeat and SOF domain-containing protein 1
MVCVSTFIADSIIRFSELFSNNRFSASGPHPLGFDAFFRGAFSYHFHNFW